MHDAFGVRLHAGKQAEVCLRYPKMPYMALCLNRAPTFSAKFLFEFSYIDKFPAFGIKICIFSWIMCLSLGALSKQVFEEYPYLR